MTRGELALALLAALLVAVTIGAAAANRSPADDTAPPNVRYVTTATTPPTGPARTVAVPTPAVQR